VRAGVLPIINENDPLSTAEMRELGRWADNDQNALLVARILGATDIILITNTNGVYHDRNDESTRIETLKAHTITNEWIGNICGEKSAGGTGGMQSKLRIGREFAQRGWTTHICDGVTSGVYEHILSQDTHGGTRTIA
jgi:glutamate 5-kinase